MTYPNPMGLGPDVPAAGTDTDGAVLSPRNHPADGPGVDYSTPSQYYGPTVAEMAPLVNPSAGNQGPTEQGMNDVNPQGPAPRSGTGPVSDRVVYPDTTQGNPR